MRFVILRAPDPQTRVRVSLPSDATAALVARRTLRDLLHGWRLTSMVEPVVLAASELVTNAFRHGRPPLSLTVRRSADQVSVAVEDGSTTEPERPVAGAADESGRGMAIVEEVSSGTGVRADDAGKVVWARFDIDRTQ